MAERGEPLEDHLVNATDPKGESQTLVVLGGRCRQRVPWMAKKFLWVMELLIVVSNVDADVVLLDDDDYNE